MNLSQMGSGVLHRKDVDGGAQANQFAAEIARIGKETSTFCGQAVEKPRGHESRLKDLEDEFIDMRPGGGKRSAGAGDNLVGRALQKAFAGEQFQALRENRIKHVSIALPAGAWHQKAAITTGTIGLDSRFAEVYGPAHQRLSIRKLLPTIPTAASSVSFARELGYTNAAAVVAEGTAKPESDLTFELINKPIATIAHWVRASKQVLDDLPMLLRFIDAELRYGLARVEEAQLLNGSGSGGNLHGLFIAATAFAAPTPISSIASPTEADVIRLALGQLESAGYTPTAIALHPAAWLMKIQLSKDGENRYLIGSPTSAAAPSLWNVPVVTSPALDADEFLVADLVAGATLVDRELSHIEFSDSDADNFTKNLITIRAEERVTLAITRPSALTKGSFSEALEVVP